MCESCNRRHNYDPTPYLEFMIAHYGPEVVAELGESRKSIRKVTDAGLRRMLEELKVIL